MLASKLLSIYLLVFSFIIIDKNPTNDLTDRAKSENKNIVIYFSGSDWCSICIRFKKEVLNREKISQLLDNNYIYYVADFPQRKQLEATVVEKNEALAEKLNKDGVFPILAITDENLNPIKILTSKTTESELKTLLEKYTK